MSRRALLALLAAPLCGALIWAWTQRESAAVDFIPPPASRHSASAPASSAPPASALALPLAARPPLPSATPPARGAATPATATAPTPAPARTLAPSFVASPAPRGPFPRRAPAPPAPSVLAPWPDLLVLPAAQLATVERLAEQVAATIGEPDPTDPAFAARADLALAAADFEFRLRHGHRAWVQLQLQAAQQFAGP